MLTSVHDIVAELPVLRLTLYVSSHFIFNVIFYHELPR